VTELHHTRLTLRFRSAGVNLDDLDSALCSTLDELRDPRSEVAQAAARMGIMPEEFVQAKVSAYQEGKGFGDVVVAIALFAPALNHAARNVWDELIWPRIKTVLGADAVGEEVAEDDDDEAADR
jgi:hypothetical protein